MRGAYILPWYVTKKHLRDSDILIFILMNNTMLFLSANQQPVFSISGTLTVNTQNVKISKSITTEIYPIDTILP